FSIYCYAPHTHLHSFPTRRSSDLSASSTRSARLGADDTTAAQRARGRTRRWHRRPSRRSSWRRTKEYPRSSATSSRTRCIPATRSEEHTSELQSRGQLVCRLLLEK